MAADPREVVMDPQEAEGPQEVEEDLQEHLVGPREGVLLRRHHRHRLHPHPPGAWMEGLLLLRMVLLPVHWEVHHQVSC